MDLIQQSVERLSKKAKSVKDEYVITEYNKLKRATNILSEMNNYKAKQANMHIINAINALNVGNSNLYTEEIKKAQNYSPSVNKLLLGYNINEEDFK